MILRLLKHTFRCGCTLSWSGRCPGQSTTAPACRRTCTGRLQPAHVYFCTCLQAVWNFCSHAAAVHHRQKGVQVEERQPWHANKPVQAGYGLSKLPYVWLRLVTVRKIPRSKPDSPATPTDLCTCSAFDRPPSNDCLRIVCALADTPDLTRLLGQLHSKHGAAAPCHSCLPG